MKRTELLQKWLELKDAENKIKEERVALEEQLYIEFEKDVLTDGKLSGTINEDEYKLTIKLNPKFKVNENVGIPDNVDVYKQVVDEKKLAQYYEEYAEWVERVWNKPTFTVVRRI